MIYDKYQVIQASGSWTLYLSYWEFHLNKIESPHPEGSRTVMALFGPPLGAKYEFQKHYIIFA